MNCFLLSLLSARDNAKAYPKKLLIKMVLEYAQMLCGAWHVAIGAGRCAPVEIPYKMGKGHLNHPVARWVRAKDSHFLYMLELAKACVDRFQEIYRSGPNEHKPEHATAEVLRFLDALGPPPPDPISPFDDAFFKVRKPAVGTKRSRDEKLDKIHMVAFEGLPAGIEWFPLAIDPSLGGIVRVGRPEPKDDEPPCWNAVETHRNYISLKWYAQKE